MIKIRLIEERPQKKATGLGGFFNIINLNFKLLHLDRLHRNGLSVFGNV
jgi:hypothetical protein